MTDARHLHELKTTLFNGEGIRFTFWRFYHHRHQTIDGHCRLHRKRTFHAVYLFAASRTDETMSSVRRGDQSTQLFHHLNDISPAVRLVFKAICAYRTIFYLFVRSDC